jgi:lipoprotein-anchoring transpeptidase ErfK/SrfK
MDATRQVTINKNPSPSTARAGLPRIAKVTLGVGIAAAALTSVIALTVAGVYLAYQALGLILPGVQVEGYSLQGLTVAEAEAELNRIWNQDTRITAVDTLDPARSWSVAPREFGISVDARATAMQAYAIGRGQGIFMGISQMISGYSAAVEVKPWVQVDQESARAGYMKWAEMVNVPVQDAELGLQNAQVILIDAHAGKALQVENSVALLVSSPASILLDYRFLPLIMEPVEPTIRDVSSPAKDLERLLEGGWDVRAYDPVTDEFFSWEPTREEIASWLVVQRTSTGFEVSVDQEKVAVSSVTLNAQLGTKRFVDQPQALSAALEGLEGEQPETLIVHYHPSEYVVRPGDNLVSIGFKVGMPYWKLLEENPEVGIKGLINGRTLSIPPKDANLELPIVTNKRIVIDIAAQRMQVYEDRTLAAEYIVSTGVASSPTLPGVFQIQSHFINAYASIWDLYMPHFMGIYKATPDLLNGIHGLPLLSSGRRLWANVLGQPASYGCIILNLDAAESLYNWAEEGVVVEIR